MGSRRKIEKKHFFVDCSVAEHSLRALMAKTVPKTRGWGISSPHWIFFRFLQRNEPHSSDWRLCQRRRSETSRGIHFRSYGRFLVKKQWMRGHHPKAGYSSLIVTDEHQILGDGCQNIFQWVKKEKNEKTIVFVEHGVAKHRFSVQFCSENQGIRHFYPRIGRFFPYFSPRNGSH